MIRVLFQKRTSGGDPNDCIIRACVCTVRHTIRLTQLTQRVRSGTERNWTGRDGRKRDGTGQRGLVGTGAKGQIDAEAAAHISARSVATAALPPNRLRHADAPSRAGRICPAHVRTAEVHADSPTQVCTVQYSRVVAAAL